MEEIAKRIRLLRESIGVSQAKLAALFGTTQSAINRYENNQSAAPPELLLRYADYFDVSMDYIYGRTDKPQGEVYQFAPKIAPENEGLRQFVEMCFDPKSPMNGKLKEALFRVIEEGEK